MSTGNEAPVQAQRMRGSDSPLRRNAGATMVRSMRTCQEVLQYFCLGVLQSEEGLGWRRPKSKSFLDLLKHKLPPVAGPSHMLCLELLAENQPFHKTKRYDYMSLTEERMESSSGPGCFNTGPAGLLARVWSNSLKMTPRNVA